MVCRGCGAEIAKGAKVCGGCGKSVRMSSKVSCFNIAQFSCCAVGFLGLLGALAIPTFLLYREKAQFNGCVQSLQSVSRGMQKYLKEKGDFKNLPQSRGNGDVICNHIIPGAEKAADCVGKLHEKMAKYCESYEININKNAPLQYEIIGSSYVDHQCGICVTEAGYCPTKYSGKEPAKSQCWQSCVEAGLGFSVCPH